MNLKQCREQWEKKAEVVLEVPILIDGFRKMFVVLRTANESAGKQYKLHRYFPIGGHWDVSVDVAISFNMEHCLLHIRNDKDYQEWFRATSEW